MQQSGDGNRAEQSQIGDHLSAHITQTGDGNALRHLQAGSGASLEIVQDGGRALEVTQYGRDAGADHAALTPLLLPHAGKATVQGPKTFTTTTNLAEVMMRKLLLATSSLAVLGAASAAFAADSSTVSITSSSNDNDLVVSQTASAGSQTSTATLIDADYNDPLTVNQSGNTDATSNLTIDGSDDNVVVVEQIGNDLVSSSVEILQASDGNQVSVSQLDNVDATAAVLLDNGASDNNAGVAIIQSENDAPVSADVYLDASSENDVRVEQYRSQYGDAADVDLWAADLSTVRVFQEYNFGAAATIAVSNGVSNTASITQKDGNVAVAGSLALDGSSNAMSIHQTGSWDLSASIDVTGDGNDFGSAGGYSISQVAVDNSGLAYGLPSAETVITGNDNWGVHVNQL